MDIGKEVKEIDFEPVEAPEPLHEPAPAQPQEPAKEPVGV